MHTTCDPPRRISRSTNAGYEVGRSTIAGYEVGVPCLECAPFQELNVAIGGLVGLALKVHLTHARGTLSMGPQVYGIFLSHLPPHSRLRIRLQPARFSQQLNTTIKAKGSSGSTINKGVARSPTVRRPLSMESELRLSFADGLRTSRPPGMLLKIPAA